MSEDLLFPAEMGDQDTLFWNLERHASLPSTVLAVAVLQSAPPRDAARRRLEVAVSRIPRLRQRVVALPRFLSNPVWDEAEDFDLDYHLRWVGAPGKGDLRGVLDLAATIGMRPFDLERPLWEVTVVEGLEGGRAALVQKLHHSITDGAAGIRLMTEFFDLEPGRPEERAAPRAATSPQPAKRWRLPRLAGDAVWRRIAERPKLARKRAERLARGLRSPVATLGGVGRDLRAVSNLYSPGPGPLSPIMHGRSRSFRYATHEVPLDALKDAAHAAGCRVNDAFLASVFGGLRRYHARHGVDPEALQLAFPINLRPAPADSAASGSTPVVGNAVVAARMVFPIQEPDPRARMRACREQVASLRALPSVEIMDSVAASMNSTPPALFGPFARWAAGSNDAVASCVPGLPTPLYLAGSRIDSLYTFGPLAGAAANVTLFSYRGDANVAISMDAVAIPDPEKFTLSIREGFDEVLEAP